MNKRFLVQLVDSESDEPISYVWVSLEELDGVLWRVRIPWQMAREPNYISDRIVQFRTDHKHQLLRIESTYLTDAVKRIVDIWGRDDRRLEHAEAGA